MQDYESLIYINNINFITEFNQLLKDVDVIITPKESLSSQLYTLLGIKNNVLSIVSKDVLSQFYHNENYTFVVSEILKDYIDNLSLISHKKVDVNQFKSRQKYLLMNYYSSVNQYKL